MSKEKQEIKEVENKNENLEENNDKPFVNMDNIDNMPILNNQENKELNLENNITQKEITEGANISMQSNEESVSYSKNESSELNINSKALYEESKRKLEPYQLNMLETIKNIEEMVKKGERQRNYKIKSEFEREKEYKLEEQSDIKNHCVIIVIIFF